MFYRHERLLSPKLSCIFHRELSQWVPVVSFAKQFTPIVLWFVYYDPKYLRFGWRGHIVIIFLSLLIEKSQVNGRHVS